MERERREASPSRGSAVLRMLLRLEKEAGRVELAGEGGEDQGDRGQERRCGCSSEGRRGASSGSERIRPSDDLADCPTEVPRSHAAERPDPLPGLLAPRPARPREHAVPAVRVGAARSASWPC